jgi:hypothetical protein
LEYQSDVLALKHALIALGYLAAQEEKDHLDNASVPVQSKSLWIVDHHEGLRPAGIASIPNRIVNADPAAQKS